MSDLIEKLSDLRSQFNCFDENEREAYHTLSEAIKVLSEQQEPYEDAVSREAVRFILPRMRFKGFNEYRVSLDLLNKLPSVTPKRKTGKWLINSDGYYPYCSECKAEPKSGEMTDFCPKCGAKMNGME